MAKPTALYSWSRVPEPVREHLALISSVGLAAFIATRVFAVAGFDPETAYIVLQTQGTGSILMGTLIPALPLLPLGAGLVCAILSSRRRQHDGKNHGWLTLSALAAIVSTLLLMPAGATFIAIGVPVLVMGGERILRVAGLWKPKREENRTSRTTVVLIAFMAGLTLLVMAVSPDPWLPHERVTYGDEHVDGYVLGRDGDELIVLRATNRVVFRVPAGSERTFCRRDPRYGLRANKWYDRSWAEIFAGSRPASSC